LETFMIPSYPEWPGCFQRNFRLRELAPANATLLSFYGPHHLFQRGADQYIVVDTMQSAVLAPMTWAEVLERYPGFGDIALPVTPDLDAVLKAKRRGGRTARDAGPVQIEPVEVVEEDGVLV
jgi:hypothetical protein